MFTNYLKYQQYFGFGSISHVLSFLGNMVCRFSHQHDLSIQNWGVVSLRLLQQQLAVCSWQLSLVQSPALPNQLHASKHFRCLHTP